ncbi:MAG: hypothetical protein HOP34_12210 [Methylococcaceae bacterium]|nr:hypothetical protein [Methylococcaceae bacterium]
MLEKKFTALQLAIINDQAALYTCACPVHISLQITNLRKLFDYQNMCIETETPGENSVELQVHQRIAEVTRQAHQLMEQCLDEVLVLEGWDRSKLEMPTNSTRKRIENH